jgi:hypothetical protein
MLNSTYSGGRGKEYGVRTDGGFGLVARVDWTIIDGERLPGVVLGFQTGPASQIPRGCISIAPPSGENGSSRRTRQTGLFTRAIDPHKIDWVIVNRWLRTCATVHQDTCGMQDPAVSNIRGFLVIDCDTREIVPAPSGCIYAALSYVWGSATSTAPYTDMPPALDRIWALFEERDTSFQTQLPAQAPTVIEDALLCTRAISLRYLWVDRYCIDQTDPSTKHSLIQRMDQIYRDAAVTIINAAGNDSHDGLPGVSNTPRHPQHTANVHGGQFAMIPRVREEVGRSTWSTRGW